MHISPVVTLCAAVGASALVLPRQTKTSTFEVTNFTAQHTPHSVEAYVNFVVQLPGYSATTCSGSNQNGNTIGDYYFRPCQDDQSYLWGLTKSNTTGLYTLAINHANAITYSGTYTFPATSDTFFQSPPGSGFEYERLTPVSNPFSVDATGQGPV